VVTIFTIEYKDVSTWATWLLISDNTETNLFSGSFFFELQAGSKNIAGRSKTKYFFIAKINSKQSLK
jgi:hypothetical protein